LKILYKLDYENPQDQNVKRILAWALVCDGRNEQAARIYEEMDEEQLQTDDYLNFGICRWLQGRISDAATLFRRYVANCPEDFQLETLFNSAEADLLQRNGISDSDIRLMTDWLSMPPMFTA
jgi:Flp pilus assembly protein TadD